MKTTNVEIYPIGFPSPEQVIELEELLMTDDLIERALDEYELVLKEKDIEVFKRDRNLLITEQGYKIACFQE